MTALNTYFSIIIQFYSFLFFDLAIENPNIYTYTPSSNHIQTVAFFSRSWFSCITFPKTVRLVELFQGGVLEFFLRHLYATPKRRGG